MKRKLGGDPIGNDSALLNYKLLFLTGTPEGECQQGVYNLPTRTTIWNYAHFYIDTHFDRSVLSRIFTLGADLSYTRALCSLTPKCLVNSVSWPRGWSWWLCTLVGGSSMKILREALWLQAPVSLTFISSSICAKFQLSIPHLQRLSCGEKNSRKNVSFIVPQIIVFCSVPLQCSCDHFKAQWQAEVYQVEHMFLLLFKSL